MEEEVRAPIRSFVTIVLKAITKWMEPYTEQQVLNCSKSVRPRSVSLNLKSGADLSFYLPLGRTLGGCPTGEARITAGYNLPA